MSKIWIKEKDINISVKILEKYLATENILNTKLRNYHWNIVSKNFSEYHNFFEEKYDESNERIDNIAERIRMLWHKTQANMNFYLSDWILSEEFDINKNDLDIFKTLENDYSLIIKSLRKDIEKIWNTNDYWTEDFLVWIIQEYEKTLWMISSYIVKKI